METFDEEFLLLNAHKLYVSQVSNMLSLPTLIHCNDDQIEAMRLELCRIGYLKPYPILSRLMLSGVVTLCGIDYIGKASDGEAVQVGNVGFEDEVESYIRQYGPDDW